MDLKQYLASVSPSKKRKSKFNNTKVTIGAKTFDSKKEAKRYQELVSLARGRHIKDLRLQVPYELVPATRINGVHQRPIKYIADFVYIEDGKEVVEDVKGVKTDVYKLKRRLMKMIHNIEIRET